jgi:glycerophosphoryl diester phosphodiesterase
MSDDRYVQFLDLPAPIAFAHRGFARDGDENSLAAFERAVHLGYRYLETDVRATVDGVPLAFHDAVLDRVTDRRGRVAELPWEYVRQARIAGREPIPLLTDLLAAWPDVRFNLDVKAAHSIGPIIEAIRRAGAVDRVCVAAFSDARIAAVRAAFGPRLCTALGPREAMLLRLPYSRPPLGRCAQVPARVGRLRLLDRGYIDRAHRLGIVVHAWTVNSAVEMRRLLDLGVDGIITDQAETLCQLLRQRGLWPTT